MVDYVLDWLHLLALWLHVIAAIAWIGSSFYFIWLDNHLEPVPAAGGVAGELWAVHGGGFYRARKYRVAPPELPPTLHWFYREAYTTWLSGFFLLCLIFFVNARAYLIDPAAAALSPAEAVALALTFLIGGWFVYDGLCRSPLGRDTLRLAIALGLVFAGEAWALCRLFSGQGAFMLFGAMLGTLMTANVLLVIIPGQREMVRAMRAAQTPDPVPGLRGKQRSTHNTYFTLPVLFVMISGHFAMTYGARLNWLVLITMCFAGGSIRAWFVARQRAWERGGKTPLLPVVLGIAAVAAVGVALAPPGESNDGGTSWTGSQARIAGIIARRCAPCHSPRPTERGFQEPPDGIVLDIPHDVRLHLTAVQQQVATRHMPLGNLTGMTAGERAALLDWIGHGAPSPARDTPRGAARLGG
ncbi:MAG: urate hydroxylase PuuD [Gammaproteobacteria bacterium]|nr:urate hydroxylase PuuD [Gammaproteobacteria bacterium]